MRSRPLIYLCILCIFLLVPAQISGEENNLKNINTPVVLVEEVDSKATTTVVVSPIDSPNSPNSPNYINNQNSHGHNVVVRNNKLYVNNREFWIKAIAYQPTPLSYSNMGSDDYDGYGFCSVKMTPWREWKSACLDSDLFDGSDASPGRVPPGPKTWFQPLWERDFPHILELGANTIRLYNVNPTTKKSTIELQNKWNDIKEPYGKDHVPFMNMAESNNLKVIFPLVSDATVLSNDTTENLQQKIKNIVDEVGDHNALIMWVVGNELDLHLAENASLLAIVNVQMEFARQYTKSKWNRDIPVTTCVTDIPESYDTLSTSLKVDVFCANAGYRGSTFTDLWSGNTSSSFSGWKQLTNSRNVPLFIGEMNWIPVDNSTSPENWFSTLYADALAHHIDGCIGTTIFEYSDESHKGVGQANLGVVTFVEYVEDGKSSVYTKNFFKPDAVKRKDIFTTISQGTPVNYNTDVWTYLRVDQTTISPSSGVEVVTRVEETSSACGISSMMKPTFVLSYCFVLWAIFH